MNRKLLGLLGIARRAGKITTGFDAVAAQIAAGECGVVLIAGDLSEKTKKELRFAANGKQVPFLQLELTKDELSKGLGFCKPIGVVSLEERGFVAAILKCCNYEEDDAK